MGLISRVSSRTYRELVNQYPKMTIIRVPRPTTSSYKDQYGIINRADCQTAASINYEQNMTERSINKNFMLKNKFCFWAPDFSDQEYDILQVHDGDDDNQDLDQDHDPKDQD